MQSSSSSSSARRGQIFYNGSAHEAIEQCKRERKLLLVFLHGLCDGESIRADAAVHHALHSHDSVLALRLYDDLNNTDPAAYEDAKFFREIFPSIKSLPFLMILNQEGDPIAELEGYEVAEGVEESLLEAASSLHGKEDSSSMHSHQTGFGDEPSPARSSEANHSSAFTTSFPAFPEFPSFEPINSMPSWGQQTPPPRSPQQTPPMSPKFSGSNLGSRNNSGFPAFDRPAMESRQSSFSNFGTQSRPHNNSGSTSNLGGLSGAMAPFPFSAPQTFGQSSSLITNFPRSEAISMAEAISKASSQAAGAAAGDAYSRAQPLQTTRITHSPSSYFSQNGLDSQVPTPMTSPKANITQDFHTHSSNSPELPRENRNGSLHKSEPQLHPVQSLGAFESSLDSRSSLPTQPSAFEAAESEPVEPSEDFPATPQQASESWQPSIPMATEDHRPYVTPTGLAPSEPALPTRSSDPQDIDSASAQETIQPDVEKDVGLVSHRSAPVAYEETVEAEELQPGLSDESAPLKRKDVLAHDEGTGSIRDVGPKDNASLPTFAHASPTRDTDTEPASLLPSQAVQEQKPPPIKTRHSVNDRPTDVVNKYRRSRSESPRESPSGSPRKQDFDSLPSSPREASVQRAAPFQTRPLEMDQHEHFPSEAAPYLGSQKLSYRRSQDSLASSPRGPQNENETSPLGYGTDSSSPRSPATLANGVTESTHTPDNVAQLLLGLTAQELRPKTPQSEEESPASPRRPATFTRGLQDTSDALAPRSAFEAAAQSPKYGDQPEDPWDAEGVSETEKAERRRSAEAMQATGPPTFRHMAQPGGQEASERGNDQPSEQRIAEAGQEPAESPKFGGLRSPKASAAKHVFTSSGSGSVDSEGKSRHRQRSPRRSNSMRRKVQKAYDAYAADKENRPGQETAAFKGFDTASHRHTSPITSPRASRLLGDLPKFEIFKFTDSNYDYTKPETQKEIDKEQHEIEMESPEKKQKLQQVDVIPLPDRNHETEVRLPTQQTAVGRAGMMSLAVGNMRLYLGALLVIVLGFLSGLFSLGAKQIVHVTPDAVKEAITQPFQLIGSQAREDRVHATKDEKGAGGDAKQIMRRRTN